MQGKPNLLPAPEARDYVGGISAMTEWRFERDPDLGWPVPVRIKRRKYYRVSELDAFLERHQVAA